MWVYNKAAWERKVAKWIAATTHNKESGVVGRTQSVPHRWVQGKVRLDGNIMGWGGVSEGGGDWAGSHCIKGRQCRAG